MEGIGISGSDALKIIDNASDSQFDEFSKMVVKGEDAKGLISARAVGKAYATTPKCLPPKGTVDINHILQEHSYESIAGKNKFLQNTNIENIIDEAISKSNINNTTLTKSIINGLEVESYVAEVDMGRTIGTNFNQTTSKTKVRLVMQKDNGNIITIYPK